MMMIYTSNESFTLYHGDNREVLKQLPDNSIDSVVTDPPYELGFMGKKWDSTGIAYDVQLWREVLRVLKPGGHLLAFSGSRTYHRMAVAIEDAGFEIRDQIMWIYGSGFPKSLDIGKAIQKASGVEPIGFKENKDGVFYGTGSNGQYNATPRQLFMPPLEGEAAEWQGWGTALKPAHEPIVMARKPLIGTVANNVLEWGVGGLNIDGTRVGTTDLLQLGTPAIANNVYGQGLGVSNPQNPLGRWPANVIHDGDPYVVELFPNDAARFFYCAKASKRDRNEGLDGFEIKEIRGGGGRVANGYDENTKNLKEAARKYGAVKVAKANVHPTVKPIDLMAYLCRLVTPAGGTVLDPFMGSGSTGKAAMYEGFKFIGIEMTDEYLPIAKARIEFAFNEESEKLPNADVSI